jgi:hypothetical protein
MPHLHTDDRTWVVTVDELVPQFFKSLRTLQDHIKKYGVIKQVVKGGNGREALYAFDSLGSKIKEEMGNPKKGEHLMDKFYREEAEVLQFFTNYNVDGAYLKSPLQKEYITNANVLIACVALKVARERERRMKGISLKGVMKTICDDATSYTKVGHTLPTSEKRFKMDFNEFLKPLEGWKFNYASCISGKVNNQNKRKVFAPELKLLNDLFAGQGKKPTRTEISRTYNGFLQGYVEVINQETGEVYEPKQFKPLSEATIINYLGSWSESIGTYAIRSGDRQKLMQQFKPYHSLRKTVFAGSIISIDDRQPPFEYAPGQRIWLYIGQDLGSEMIVACVYGKSKEGIITEFYRQLLRNYSDWGFNLPLELEAESSLNSSFKDTFLRPGAMFEHVRIEANNARGKRVEGTNRVFRYEYDKQREGFIARPFAQSESNQAGPGKKVIVPYSQIVQGCLKDIEDYNNTSHSIHKDKLRWDYFCENQHPDTKPTNWKALLPHLGYATKTTVKTGILKLQGKEFLLGVEGKISVGEQLISLMRRLEGDSVTVYWLDGNDGEVLKAIIYINDTYICDAVAKPMYSRSAAEFTDEDKQAREIMSAYVATIDGYMNRKIKSIEEVLVLDNSPKPLRKFVMPGLNRYEASDSTAEIMDTEDTNDNDDFAFIPQQQNRSSFIKSTKDRI